MLDAKCRVDGQQEKIYSVFTFQRLAEAELESLRQQLYCPVCDGKAYFRKASKDGKAACFGSRYHRPDCSEFNPSASRQREESDALEVQALLLENDALKIDFSQAPRRRLAASSAQTKPAKASDTAQSKIKTTPEAGEKSQQNNAPDRGASPQAADQAATADIAREGLEKLLHSLLRGCDLASSDLWVYTDDKYRWRAKNLFVNFADATPTDNGAPRMYWGTVSHADKAMLWLNPADCKDVGIPIDAFKSSLCQRFDIEHRRDIEGAGIILFGKCFWNKDKTRKIIQLWNKDVSRMHIAKAED